MRYIFGLRGDENAFAQSGKLAHSILERYAKGELELFELSEVFEKEFQETVTEKFPKFFKDLRSIYYNDTLKYFNNFEGFGNYKILAVEDRFKTEIDDWIFIGIIDLLLEDENGNIIIEDHKSKSSFKNKAEQKKYARQLYLYAHYIIKKYGKRPIKLVFNMFRKQDLVEIPFSDEDYNEALSWARNTVTKIREEEDYKPTYDEFFCNNLCDFRERFCRFKKELSKGKCK